MYENKFNNNIYISWTITILSWIAFIWQCYGAVINKLNDQIIFFLLCFSLINVLMLTARRIYAHIIPFRLNFLLSSFTMLIAWRLSVLAGLPYISQIYLIALLLKLVNFSLAAYYDIKASRQYSVSTKLNTSCSTVSNVCFEWQLTFIRIFIGFDLVPHFCEKLFAGSAIRNIDTQIFTQLGLSHAIYFVLIAGLFEFFGSISIACGFLTRLGSICLCIYLIVSTYLGHHFSVGFIWASPGGGWEFPVLWTVLIISFSIFGANKFSFDELIASRYKLPTIIKFIMGFVDRS